MEEIVKHHVDDAARNAPKAVSAMDNACHGRFAHYYDNDCFVGVRLTSQVLESVRGWLRLRGDGSLLYNWERKYLIPGSSVPYCKPIAPYR